jgi:hypothetical protein
VRALVFLLALLAAACASSQAAPADAAGDDTGDPDAPTSPDAPVTSPDAPVAVPDAPVGAPDAAPVPDGPPGAYRHTIAIDGTNDFAAGDTFATTSSPEYEAYVTWDDANLYLGYRGPDLDTAALDADTKWVFAYVDLDPGAGTGAAQSLTYNTQHASFPAGFAAELYFRWKCSGAFSSIELYDGAGWTASATGPTTARSGDFLEVAIPRSLFAGAATVGVATWMINEKPNFEGSYAGLYAGNFTDGYTAVLPITRYLAADFAATSVPSDPANQAP